MIKHTTLNLNTVLVHEAQKELGTTGITETVHAALQDVVRRAAMKRLAEYDFDGMTLADLGEMRQISELPGEREQ